MKEFFVVDAEWLRQRQEIFHTLDVALLAFDFPLVEECLATLRIDLIGVKPLGVEDKEFEEVLTLAKKVEPSAVNALAQTHLDPAAVADLVRFLSAQKNPIARRLAGRLKLTRQSCLVMLDS